MSVGNANSYSVVDSVTENYCNDALNPGNDGDFGSKNKIKRRFPHLLTIGFRLSHATGYMIGCALFLLGSFQYMPTVENFKLGGWLFTIGSAGFIFADTTEWWRNNRVGCMFDSEYAQDFEVQGQRQGLFSAPAGTWAGDFQRAENGLNVALSVCGSILYFAGSILFLPVEDALVSGIWIFVWGGLLVMVSQMWKVYRTIRAAWRFGLRNSAHSHNNKISSKDIKGSNRNSSVSNRRTPNCKSILTRIVVMWQFLDVPAVIIDLFGCVGAFCYLVGSIYLLPQFDISVHFNWVAACWFIAGGCSYVLSALCQYYRYFYTSHAIFSPVWCDNKSVGQYLPDCENGDGDATHANTGRPVSVVELTNTTSPIFTIE